MTTPTKRQLLNALNRIDELASITAEDNDNGEAQRLAKDYELLYHFINDLDN